VPPALTTTTEPGAARATEEKPKIASSPSTTLTKPTKVKSTVAKAADRVVIASTTTSPATPLVTEASADTATPKPTATMTQKPKAVPTRQAAAKPVITKPQAAKVALAPAVAKPGITITEKPVTIGSRPTAAKPLVPVSKLGVTITEKPTVDRVMVASERTSAPANVVVAMAPKAEKPVAQTEKFRTVIRSAEKASARTASLQLPSAGRIKMRDLVNRSSGTILWDSKTKTVTAYVNNIKIELRIGHSLVKVNGKMMKVSLVPYIQNGRTIVDVRLYHRALALAGRTVQKTAKVPAK
jgi:hypothetical protein